MKYKVRNGHGWDTDNIYPLEDFLNAYGEIEREAYELRNCVRTCSLIEMRDRLKSHVEEMKQALDDISDDDGIEEVE